MNPEHVEQSISEKELVWREKREAVNHLVDRLGLGVDEGIKDAVAALHLFDINTTASHEGKIDRYPIPWIDIEATDLRPERLEKFKDSEEVSEEERLIRAEILEKNITERRKIADLLEEFYKDRDVSYDVRLYIRPQARGRGRLESQGADFQEIERDEQIREEKLLLFQDEMNAFTEFLKNKYFSEEK